MSKETNKHFGSNRAGVFITPPDGERQVPRGGKPKQKASKPKTKKPKKAK